MLQPRHTARRSRQGGQAAVLAALCMFTMFVFVALATNMGVLASDRIRMQNVADAAAYAGALEQARVLNKVRLHMKSMVRRAAGIRWLITLEISPGPRLWPYSGSCSESEIPEKILDAYDQLNVLKRAEVVQLLRRGTNSAERAAQFTAQKNMKGMGFGRSFESFRVYPNSPTFFMKSLLEPPDEGEIVSDEITTQLSPANVQFSYAFFIGSKKCKGRFWKLKCAFNLSSCIKVKTRTVDTWWYKGDTDPTVFFPLRLVGTPLKRFFDLNRYRGYFGAGPRTPGKRNNQITVLSAAKPYDGGIAPNPSRWPEINETQSVTVLMGVRKNLHTWDGIVDTAESFYDDTDTRYRARLVGLREQVGNQNGGGPPIASFQQLLTSGPDPHSLSGEDYGKILH